MLLGRQHYEWFLMKGYHLSLYKPCYTIHFIPVLTLCGKIYETPRLLLLLLWFPENDIDVWRAMIGRSLSTSLGWHVKAGENSVLKAPIHVNSWEGKWHSVEENDDSKQIVKGTAWKIEICQKLDHFHPNWHHVPCPPITAITDMVEYTRNTLEQTEREWEKIG